MSFCLPGERGDIGEVEGFKGTGFCQWVFTQKWKG